MKRIKNEPLSPFACSICGLSLGQCKCKEKLGNIDPNKKRLYPTVKELRELKRLAKKYKIKE